MKPGNIRRRIGIMLILLGILLIIAVVAVNAVDIIKSNKAIKQFKDNKVIVDTGDTSDSDTTSNGIEISNNLDDSSESSDEYDLSQIIGLLKISKINLEEAVREGSSNSVLSSALGHMPETALPGAEGNCCIAGHRNYTFGKYFNRLNEVEIGDDIEIETYTGDYIYEVYDIFVVEPTEVSVLNDMSGENLTLITCTPLFIGSHRLIIRAKLVARR